ncbi:MAG: AAA family ATPase [Candidatus Altiarchaeota archaeon]|nr:AAA family ATPase [Candidatus Altiarchaeota archaeon]
MVEKAKSGIPGLDELLEGGFPRGRTILLSGTTGTGKTIFGMQFLHYGATLGEPGIYLTLEEKPKNLRAEMKEMGMDISKFEKEGKIAIIDASLVRLGLESDEKFTLSPETFDINHLIQNVIMTARNMGAKRVVVDALPSLDILLDNDKHKIRNAIIEMNYLFQENELTTILLSEIPVGGQSFAPHGVEEYVVDGVITLHLESLGAQSSRTLIIHKMRLTKHNEAINSFEIVSGKGISVIKEE